MTRQILIGFADDHKTVRKSLIPMLEADGKIRLLVEAENGIQLLRKIEELTILPDVCLVDIQMPKMGGLELLGRLRKEWPSIKTIVVSGFWDELIVLSALTEGAMGYLAKSSDPDEIVTAIKTVAEGDHYYSTVADLTIFNKIKRNKVKLLTYTQREIDFMRYVCMENLSYADIANRMGISPRSIDAFRDNLYDKLDVRSRVGLAMAAVHLGIHSFHNTPRQ